MPLKTIIRPVTNPQEFDKAVNDYMEVIHQQFLAFNKQHVGKRAEVSRSVTFHVTAGHLVCILYYTWGLASDQSDLWTPGQQAPAGSRTQ